ncbi:hypothetical protein ACJZ2D_009669 [Fusarium nematophilum]
MTASSPAGLDVHGELQGPGGVQDSGHMQSAPLSRFQTTIEYNAQVGRRFKACRTCRKHKLKCERNNNGACQRCHDNGAQCVFDTVGARKREPASKRSDVCTRSFPAQLSPGPKSPTDRVRPRTMQAAAVDLGLPPAPAPAPSQGLVTGRAPSVRGSPTEADAYHHTPTTQPSELTSEDLRAPVSAMHNMSQYEGSTHRLSKTPTDAGYSAHQRSAFRPGLLFGRETKQEDMVSKGILDQRSARQLFNTFMASASSFLPIFDPILDSFETLRCREPFCFAVILTLASCIDGSLLREQCLKEVKELVAGSLFHYPASLGKVQGMILLVAYAESTWFAIGHALQMALDLGLDKTLSHEQMPDRQSLSHSEGQRQVIRSARVWLALCFIEREIAIGTARLSRIPKVPPADLAHFTCQSQAHPPNMRLASLVEAVQIRDEFLSTITSAEDLEDSGLHQLRCMEARFEEWLQHWDALHKDCGYDVSSFQRTSLYGQKRYAMIFLGCATLGRISGSRQLSVAIKDLGGAMSEIIDFVISIAMDQLHLVLQSESYRWHLKWATNYTILSLTFTAIFTLEISRHRDDLNAREVFNTVAGISQILADYHDPFFHQLIHVRLSQHPGASPRMETGPTHVGYDDQLALDYSPKPASAHQNPVNLAASDARLQLPVDAMREPLAPGMGFDGVHRQNTLNQLLETPDWMMNPSSMLVFDLNSWQNNDDFGANC